MPNPRLTGHRVYGVFRQTFERADIRSQQLTDAAQGVRDESVNHVRPDTDRRHRDLARQAIDARRRRIELRERLRRCHDRAFEHIVCQ